MLKIAGHIIYEKKLDELTEISPIKERSETEKRDDQEMRERPWWFYYSAIRSGAGCFKFKPKRSAAIARNRLIKAKAEYDRKPKKQETVKPKEATCR
jgi:hypothetical protein